jgi:hypothetical protein
MQFISTVLSIIFKIIMIAIALTTFGIVDFLDIDFLD